MGNSRMGIGRFEFSGIGRNRLPDKERSNVIGEPVVRNSLLFQEFNVLRIHRVRNGIIVFVSDVFM